MSAGKSEVKAKKAAIVSKFAQGANDTGSPEVQVALITTRINELNGHFKSHPKDYHSMQGLYVLVGQRRRLLNYLKKSDESRYQKLIGALELRK